MDNLKYRRSSTENDRKTIAEIDRLFKKQLELFDENILLKRKLVEAEETIVSVFETAIEPFGFFKSSRIREIIGEYLKRRNSKKKDEVMEWDGLVSKPKGQVSK